MYLFATRENRAIFVNDPENYLDESEIEPAVTKPDASAAAKQAAPAVIAPAVIAPAGTAPATIPNLPPIAPPANSAAAFKNPAPVTTNDDELPVLSDNLDDLPPLNPVVMPSNQRPAPAGAPAAVSTDAANSAAPVGRTPAPIAPKPSTAPANPAPVIPAGPRLEIPLMKKATRNTPASYTVPQKPVKAPSAPRLISPDLQRMSPGAGQ